MLAFYNYNLEKKYIDYILIQDLLYLFFIKIKFIMSKYIIYQVIIILVNKLHCLKYIVSINLIDQKLNKY